MTQSYISIGSNIDATKNITSAKRELSNILPAPILITSIQRQRALKEKILLT